MFFVQKKIFSISKRFIRTKIRILNGKRRIWQKYSSVSLLLREDTVYDKILVVKE